MCGFDSSIIRCRYFGNDVESRENVIGLAITMKNDKSADIYGNFSEKINDGGEVID